MKASGRMAEKCWNCYGFGYVMVSTGNTTTPHERYPCPYCHPQPKFQLSTADADAKATTQANRLYLEQVGREPSR